ncbi:MAG: ABC transporter ATP-binding protein [Micropruina sp.]|uniref:ABC transporter ATP-binding protein n=1 Tax=Micropruina sp. TaxID=2737536 RepID=UPI0039E4208D
MLTCTDITRVYQSRQVLGPVSIEVRPGEQVAIMGPSGAGKSTLLYCLAGLETPNSGTVTFLGKSWMDMSVADQRAHRLRRMGLLFQTHDLLPELTLLQNVALPLEFSGSLKRNAERRSAYLLGQLGLAHLQHSRPNEVSGGEAQRAALARAFAMEPPVVLADEPTGSLDSAGRDAVLEVLGELTQQAGIALVVVTHDPVVAAALGRTITIVDGVLGGLPDAG